jgi:HK97 family phage prohead protease
MKVSKRMGGKFYERIHPDAFKKHLATNPDVYASIDHDTSKLLGTTQARTLSLENKPEGLFVHLLPHGVRPTRTA